MRRLARLFVELPQVTTGEDVGRSPCRRRLFGWLVDAYFRLGEPAHAREVVGDGLARLLRAAGFAVAREGPQGAVPMQILTARPSGR